MTAFLNHYSPYFKYAAAGFFALVIIYFMFSRPSSSKSRRKIYAKDVQIIFNAMKCLYKYDMANFLMWLKKAAKFYPDEVAVYIFIGDLIRYKRPQKAAAVHKGLLFRKNMTNDEKGEILLSLGRDYVVLNELNKALSALRQSYSSKRQAETLEELVVIEKKLRLYEDAVNHQRELNKIVGADKDSKVPEIVIEAMAEYTKENDLEELRQWLNRYHKLDDNSPFALLAGIFVELMDSKEKRATSLANEFAAKFPGDEIALRFIILGGSDRLAMNDAVEGKWKQIFAMIYDSDKAVAAKDLDGLDKKTVLYYHLYARTLGAGEVRNMIADAGSRENIFVCGSCGSAPFAPALVCQNCGSKLNIILKRIDGGQK